MNVAVCQDSLSQMTAEQAVRICVYFRLSIWADTVKKRKTEVWSALILDGKCSWCVSLCWANTGLSVFISCVCRALSFLARRIYQQGKHLVRLYHLTGLIEEGVRVWSFKWCHHLTLNKLAGWRGDMELIYCRETGRADLHKMNAKPSPQRQSMHFVQTQ